MAKTENSAKSTSGFMPTMTDSATKNAERMLFGAAHIQGSLFRSMLRYNLEAMRFLNHRLEADLKTADSFAKCSSFSELNDASMEFCQRAVEEYSDEAAKLANLGAGLMSEAAEDVQREAAQATVQ